MWQRLISKSKHKHSTAADHKENTTSTATHDKQSTYRLANHAQQALSNAWRSTAEAAAHGAHHLGLVTKQVCTPIHAHTPTHDSSQDAAATKEAQHAQRRYSALVKAASLPGQPSPRATRLSADCSLPEEPTPRQVSAALPSMPQPDEDRAPPGKPVPFSHVDVDAAAQPVAQPAMNDPLIPALHVPALPRAPAGEPAPPLLRCH